MTEAPILEVENLRVDFDTDRGLVASVGGVTFGLGREKLGIVGESGSGKSVTGRAILGLVRPPGRVYADRLVFRGMDLMAMSPKSRRRLLGAQMSMVMQDPKYSLHPVKSIGTQLVEAIRLHSELNSREAKEKAVQILERVRIHDPKRVCGMYAHELSGGMGQRVMVAMMVAPNPSLLIADEPTSALDKTVQLDVLHLLEELVQERHMSLLLISHDLKLVSRFCDRVVVMYRGRIVETCTAEGLYAAEHPYTRALLESVPVVGDERRRLRIMQRDDSWLK